MIDKERAKDTAGHAANVAATATATRPLSSTPTTGFSPPVSSSDKAGGFFGSLRLKNSSVFSRNKSSTAAEQPSIPNSQPRAGHATRPLPPIPTTFGKGLRYISSQAGIPRSPATINGHHFTEYLDSWKTTPVGASGGKMRYLAITQYFSSANIKSRQARQFQTQTSHPHQRLRCCQPVTPPRSHATPRLRSSRPSALNRGFPRPQRL